MGFDAVLFERGDIPYSPEIPVDESCNNEITNCQMLILILGGRYGNPTTEDCKKDGVGYPESYRSVTRGEFEQALKMKIPIFVLIEKNVFFEYNTYKKNITNKTIKYAQVDHINVFKLIDDIHARQKSIYIQPFENFDDISNYLREQFAGLFADFLLKRNKERELKELEERIIELKEITEALKEYTESIMKEIKPKNYEQIIDSEKEKIQHGIARRFVREGFIDFILRKHPNYTRLDPIKVFLTFEKAKNLNVFLNKMELGDQYESFIKGESLGAAEYEYDELKEKYFDYIEDGCDNLE
jgi:hypothetical protein